ncbi:MAG: ATP-binding protein [Pseudomonadota bacterium]|nr:ATP-binding protein [Pseudomonadota bacterium]
MSIKEEIQKNQAESGSALGAKIFKIFVWVVTLTIMGFLTLLMSNVILNPAAKGPIYLALININILFAVLFLAFIGHRFVHILLERRRGVIGTRMNLRFVALFSVFAVVPAFLVGVGSLWLLNQGIEGWFSNRVTTALDGSVHVARSYLKEHEKNLQIRTDVIAKSPELASSAILADREFINLFLEKRKHENFFSSLRLYNDRGDLVAHADPFPPTALNNDLLRFIRRGLSGGMTLQDLPSGQIWALSKVDDVHYVVAVKLMDPQVLEQVAATKEAYAEYDELHASSADVRSVFVWTLLALSLSSLAGAIWFGFKFAYSITKPVTALVHATNKVSAGDLDVRLTPLNDDELGILTQSFNRMASQLQNSQNLLESKNKEVNERRKITEAVLTGVSAGVFSLDDEGLVHMANVPAFENLHLKVGERLDIKHPELGQLFDSFMQRPMQLYQEKLSIRIGDETRKFLFRLVPQMVSGGKVQNVVVTFDDITELLSAQKVAAWSDVARRIAHEIKNPLTPIQLSAERIKRRYSKKMEEPEDKELFEQLTGTIVRQVEEMRRMVNEFSDFARMPAAVMKEEDIAPLLKEIVLLQQQARPDIQFDLQLPQEGTLNVMCDASQISRVFTNIVENAVNAIEEDENPDKKNAPKDIKIVVEMSQSGKLVTTVKDSGKGLPADVDVSKLFDPYVTTRKKGTGLGLAIVRRVVDEHGGQIRLSRREEGGTCVEIIFPLTNKKE